MKIDEQRGIVYKEIKPKSNLSIFVKSFWYFENKKSKIQNYSILPNGCFVLLIYFEKTKKKEVYLTGLWNTNIEVAVPANTEIFAIRFRPLASEYIIKQKIADLLNSGVIITDNNFAFFKQINANYQDFDSFITSNTIILQSIFETGKGIDSRKEKVFELLFKNQGVISVKELSEQTCWSNRQMSRYFKENYGLSVKKYANILRVNSAYKDLVKGLPYPQTEYFDQSHFIKEIKKYTGVNPSALIKNKNDRFLQLFTKQLM